MVYKLFIITLIITTSHNAIFSNNVNKTKCYKAFDLEDNFAEVNITYDFNDRPKLISYVYSDEEAILSYAGIENVYIPLYNKYEKVKVYSAVFYGEITGKLYILSRKKYDNTEIILKSKKGFFYLKQCY